MNDDPHERTKLLWKKQFKPKIKHLQEKFKSAKTKREQLEVLWEEKTLIMNTIEAIASIPEDVDSARNIDSNYVLGTFFLILVTIFQSFVLSFISPIAVIIAWVPATITTVTALYEKLRCRNVKYPEFAREYSGMDSSTFAIKRVCVSKLNKLLEDVNEAIEKVTARDDLEQVDPRNIALVDKFSSKVLDKLDKALA